VDTTPPVVTHGSDGVWNPGANPSATDGTSGIQTRTFSVDGQARTWQSHENLCSNLDLADGVHTVSVHATDYAGHENAGNTSFKCDLTPPRVTTVTVTPPAFSPLLSQTTRVETEISDSYPATWTLTITNAHDALVREAGGAYSPNYHLTWTWDGRDANGNIVADGTYTITVSATDQVGHRTDETITVAVDTTPPSLVVSRPEDMLHTGGRALYVEAFSDPGATFRILVNGQWLRDWTFSNTGVITDIISTRRWLSAGENELCFKVWDDLGNSQEETRLVTYENGEPTISNSLPAPRSILTQTRPTLSASFTMSGTGEIYTPTALVKLDGTDVTTQSIITSAGFVYTPTVSLDEGFHGVHVQVQSTVSRTGSANWSFDIDRSTWLNVTAPLSGTRLNALTTTVRGEGEPGADVTVTVNDAPAGTGTVDTWGSVQIDHVTLTTGTQTLQVDIVDSVGNRQVETLSVTVDPYRPGVSADAQPPAFSPGRCLPQTTFVLEAHPPSGEAIAAWRLDVLSGTTVVTSVNGINLPPSTVTWDGRGDDGTLLEGTYRYTLAVTATNGMTNTTVPQPVYIDLTPPAAPEIETPHNNTEVDEWRIWVSGVADPGSTITLLDGGYFTHTLTTTVGLDGRWSAYYPLHGGINDVYAIATDASCEASEPSDTHHIMLWANPPLHTVGISPTLVSAGNTVILWATARHDNPYEGAPTIGVWTQLPRAGSVPLTRTHTLQEGARGWWEVDDTVKPSLPSGDYAVFYEGVDEDGQLGDGETALVVRNQPPTPRITAPRSPRYTAESQVILDGEVDASELTVQVADGENILDEQAIGLQMYWHMEVQVPGEGPHPLRARAEDRFGQYSEWSEAVTMTLDTTPPVVTMTASSPYTHAWFFPVGWPATDPPAGSAPGAGVSSYDVQWRFDPPPGSSTEETGWTKVWSFPIYRTQTSYWPEMGEGIYWFRARARDVLNNQSTYTATTPVSVTVDRTDPHIRLTVTEATPYAIVDGTMIIYGAHESSFTVTATLSDALAGLHKVTFTETVSSGATYHQADGVQETAVSHIYTFDAADTFSGRGTVVVNDRAANTREAHFRMQQDATPPTVHLTAAPAGDNIRVTWESTDNLAGVDDGACMLDVRTDGGAWEPHPVACAGAWDYGEPGHRYEFRVTAHDHVGNAATSAVAQACVPSVTKYYYLGSQRVALRKDGAVTYLHPDHLGSTSLATDAVGKVVARRRYHPYGDERYVEGDVQTDVGYTGQRDVVGTGLMYYHARYYHPALGRFISADTIVPEPGNPQALNRYAYVKNNPLRYVDPSGHYSKDEIMKAFGVSSWKDVLAFFQKGSGEYLEDRWGWLEILRRGEDGDMILSNPWDEVSDLYGTSFKLHRNNEGQILVGEMDHEYFAHHQKRYTLISSRLSMPFSTPYNRMHWHINIEQHKFGHGDLEAILMDLLSITVEGAGYLGTPLVGPGAGVGGMGAQFILDATGYNGAVNSFIRMLQPKKHGGFTSDEILAMGGLLQLWV